MAFGDFKTIAEVLETFRIVYAENDFFHVEDPLNPSEQFLQDFEFCRNCYLREKGAWCKAKFHQNLRPPVVRFHTALGDVNFLWESLVNTLQASKFVDKSKGERDMKLQVTFVLLSLLAMVAFAGCYTQLGYQGRSLQADIGSASSDFDGNYRTVLEEEKTEDHAEAESEELESEHTDGEALEGYYGRRKYTHRETSVYPRRHYDTYSGTYPLYPYGYYLPVMPYYSHPWFYRYGYYYGYSPYYRYYRGYYPYTNVYRRYYGRSRYVPLSRRTYDRRDWRPENRRSRSSRSVTSPKSRSERPQRRTRNQKP